MAKNMSSYFDTAGDSSKVGPCILMSIIVLRSAIIMHTSPVSVYHTVSLIISSSSSPFSRLSF